MAFLLLHILKKVPLVSYSLSETLAIDLTVRLQIECQPIFRETVALIGKRYIEVLTFTKSVITVAL